MAFEDITIPTELIRFQEPNVSFNLQNKGTIGKGTLYVTEQNLVWCNELNKGFEFQYTDISLHAVSNQITDSIPYKHLLMVVTADLDENEVDSDSDKSLDAEATTTIRLIPDNSSSLDAIYKAMCDCQLLHPDPNASGDDDDEEYNEDDNEWHGFSNGNEQNRINNIFASGDGPNTDIIHFEESNLEEPMEDGQFDDAD